MRLLVGIVLVALSGPLWAQETPLTTLPYTPSLSTEFMDRSVDPCTDFYKYACGNWNKLNPIPGDQSSWNVYRKVADDNQRLLWGILQEASKPDPKRTPNEQKIGDFFASCMNEAAVEQAGATPLNASLQQISGLQSPEDFAKYVAFEHRTGIDGGVLFGFGSGQDFADSSQVIAFATAGGLGLPDRDYYTKTDAKSVEIRKKYQDHVAEMLQLLGESGFDANGDAAAVMKIESALANSSLTRVEQRDPYKLNHPMTRDAFDRITPAFDWEQYLSGIHAPSFQKANVMEPNFFTELNSLLTSEKLPAWRAYFRWHLVHAYSRYLSPKFAQPDFAFFSTYLNGVPKMPPRWKTCTRLVDRQLGEALGQVFVAKTFSPQTKDEAQTMTRQIEDEMGTDIQSLSWMTDATKKQALLKLHAIVNKVGYPDKWRDYSAVNIARDSFAHNVQEGASFEESRDLNKIGKPVDRSEWEMTPPTVNAYYAPQTNDINFPAGVLQPPLFDPKMDSAPNYGNTGATIGHELTHGFDDEGRQFDAKGDLKDWWTSADSEAFNKRVGCVKDQYAGYTVIDDIKINSSLTLGEDVADLGGTLLAYMAWKRHTPPAEMKTVDGLNPDQRFFIGMAQWACGDERSESKRAHAIVDPHSPDEFRINGVVSNLPEFGTAFGCKVGQPMMRANACRVW
jgi:putative endopeptidase